MVKSGAFILLHGHNTGILINSEAATRIARNFEVHCGIEAVPIKPLDGIDNSTHRRVFSDTDSIGPKLRRFIQVENLDRYSNVVINGLECGITVGQFNPIDGIRSANIATIFAVNRIKGDKHDSHQVRRILSQFKAIEIASCNLELVIIQGRIPGQGVDVARVFHMANRVARMVAFDNDAGFRSIERLFVHVNNPNDTN